MATIVILKEKALIEDLDVGMGDGHGEREGKQINATNIPYSSERTIAEELDLKESIEDGDIRYAFKNGSPLVLFHVLSAREGTHAVNLDDMLSALSEYSPTTDIGSWLNQKADVNGNPQNIFKALNPEFNESGPFPANDDVVVFGYLIEWYLGVIVPELALKSYRADVIEKGNNTDYTPTTAFDPANKQYVDSKFAEEGLGDMLEVEFASDVSASKAVFSTKNVGSFNHPNGQANADVGVMKLSKHVMTDANTIINLGINIFIGTNILNGPPASTDIPVAVEQMAMDSTGDFIGQRATTDIGVFSRFGFDNQGTMVFTEWSHSIVETDYCTPFVGGTIKMRVTGNSCALTNNGSDAVIP